MSIIPRKGLQRLVTFGIAAAATAGVLIYMEVTNWFTFPHLGIVGVALTSLGAALIVTTVSTGLKKRRALYASLIVVAIGLAVYFPS